MQSFVWLRPVLPITTRRPTRFSPAHSKTNSSPILCTNVTYYKPRVFKRVELILILPLLLLCFLWCKSDSGFCPSLLPLLKINAARSDSMCNTWYPAGLDYTLQAGCVLILTI